MSLQFRREREMAQPVANWLRARCSALKAEFSLPWGICDFVGVSVDRRKAKQRLEMGQRTPIGPAARVRLLKEIPDVEDGRSVTIHRLEQLLAVAMDPERVRQEVAWLERHGFVKLSRSGRAQKLNSWVPLHRRIVAIELKLTRIQEAFWQASAHRRFADEVYVALPSPVAYRLIRSARVAHFREVGIGVVAVWPRRCRALLRSTPGLAPDPVAQMHVVERFWRTHRGAFV